MNVFRSALTASVCMAGLVHGDALQAMEIVDEGGIGKYWQAAPGASFVAPGYPSAMKERAATVCVSLAYSVGDDGIPADFVLMGSWSRDAKDVALLDDELEPFVQSAAQAVSQWRFSPKDSRKPVPVRTTATLVFKARNDLPTAQVASNCRTHDLAGQMQQRRGQRMNEVTRTFLTQKQAADADRYRAQAEAAAAARERARQASGN